MIFRDRDQAARLLEQRLSRFHGARPVVLGVPRGAVPMAKIIADALDGDLDIVLVHKVGYPGHPEFALGSVTEEGGVYLGMGAESAGLDENDIADSARIEIAKLAAKRQLFTPHRRPVEVGGRIVIIVDDGIATGATMTAAVRSVREKGAASVIVATPVASNDAIRRLEAEGAEVVSVLVPEVFFAVSQFYEDFAQVEDEEVIQALSGHQPEVKIRSDGSLLRGFLVVPDRPRGMIVFAHGSGSGRHSPRNHFVARVLQDAGFATLLVDLLTEEEMEDRSNVFDIDLLADRLNLVDDWLKTDPQLEKLPLGIFGASTGAAAAIRAEVKSDGQVAALVLRGGRPDLATESLGEVKAATLFVIGGNDEPVLSWNRKACEQMHCERDVTVIPKAGHLFEEPGALEQVAYYAARWFQKHLPAVELSAEDGPHSAAGPEITRSRRQ